MKTFWKATVQGTSCGVMIGLVLLIGGRFWQPRTAEPLAPSQVEGQLPGLALPALTEVEGSGVEGAPVQDVVRARQIEVVDEAGKSRISLATTGLALHDGEGKLRAVLGMFPHPKPVTAFHDVEGNPQAALETPRDEPALVLLDAMGKERAMLSISPDGSAVLALLDVQGKKRALLRTFPDGRPGLFLRDAQEQERAVLTTLPDGAPRLFLSNPEGKPRACLETFSDGTPVLFLLDAAGNVTAKLP